MNKIPLKVVNKSNNPLPKYQTEKSAGLDLYAWTDEPITIIPGDSTLIKTGLHIALPDGYEAQIRPRSGLAFKKQISIVNSPGTIDSDYRGDIGVILINHGKEDFVVNNGDRIAQMIINQVVQANFEETKELDDTERGHGGFGHTGNSK
jgi:dUTP pyrophosphatase